MSAVDVTATDEAGLGRAFRWLTRTGAGRHFGSMPIGWYQAHQCHALDIIRDECRRLGLDPTRVHVVRGRYRSPFIEGPGRAGWCELDLTPSQVFQEADKRSRA